MTEREIYMNLFNISINTYYNWKKENRPIIKLLEKYFSKENLKEFLETENIAAFELLKFTENKLAKKLFSFVESIFTISNNSYFYTFLVNHLKNENLFYYDENTESYIWEGSLNHIEFKESFYEFIKDKELSGKELFLFSNIINELNNEDIKYLQLNLKNTFRPLYNYLNKIEHLDDVQYSYSNKFLEKIEPFTMAFYSFLNNSKIDNEDLSLDDIIKKSNDLIVEIQQNIIKKIEERKTAIKDCYGVNAILENKTIKLSTGEIITAWKIEDILDVESLEKNYKDQEIKDIYNSGL